MAAVFIGKPPRVTWAEWTPTPGENSGILDYNKTNARLQSSPQPCRSVPRVVCHCGKKGGEILLFSSLEITRSKKRLFSLSPSPLTIPVVYRRQSRLSRTSSSAGMSPSYEPASDSHGPLVSVTIMAAPNSSGQILLLPEK